MMMPSRMIAASAKYEPVPNGAKLTLTPKDPAKLEAFRKQVREHAERMPKRHLFHDASDDGWHA